MTIQLHRTVLFAILALGLLLSNSGFSQDVTEQVEHRYADNDGVRIHYAVMGSGPLIVMVHGFPDY